MLVIYRQKGEGCCYTFSIGFHSIAVLCSAVIEYWIYDFPPKKKTICDLKRKT